MNAKVSSALPLFEKVLRGFETGGFTYTDVLQQLERLLATGESPAALMEILQRRESVEPLPEYAHDAVLGVLNGALARDEAQEQTSPEEAQSTTAFGVALRETASGAAVELAAVRADLAAEQNRTRELETAVSAKLDAIEAMRSSHDESLSDSDRFQTESRTLRDSLETRDGQLAALKLEHSKLASMLAARVEKCAQLETEARESRARSAAITAELQAVRASLESEQGENRDHQVALTTAAAAALSALQTEKAKVLELDQALSDKNAQSLNLRNEQAMQETERNQQELRKLRELLATRESEIGSLQQERRNGVPALEARARALAQLQADLLASQSRVQELESMATATQQKISKLEGQVKDQDRLFRAQGRELNTTLIQLESARTQSASLLEQLRSHEWRREYGAQIEKAEQIEKVEQVERVERVEHSEPVPSAMHVTNAEAERQPSANPPNPRAALFKGRGLWLAILILAAAAAVFNWRQFSPASSQLPVKAATTPGPGSVVRDCPTCPTLTVLPVGRFYQGSGAGASSFEKPMHGVVIRYPLAIATSAITVGEFGEFAAATGRDMQGCDTYDGEWKLRPGSSWKNPGFAQTGTHPVACVSWSDAQAYVNWLSMKTGKKYRLPSASEWEFAARAGRETAVPWAADGSGACADANVADGNAGKQYPGWAVFPCSDGYVFTAPVGTFKANAFGLNDMLGNVFQWTEDCWHADYTGAPTDGSARVNADCSEHELRGGSWFSSPALVRANYRNHFPADYRTSSVGIRVARVIEPSDAADAL
jgi:formylglycine-generating enzyme